MEIPIQVVKPIQLNLDTNLKFIYLLEIIGRTERPQKIQEQL